MNKFALKTLVIVAYAFVMPFAVLAQETAPLSISCSPEMDAANIGDTVTWEANVSGGEAPYSYTWSASSLGSQENPISGSSETASKTYTTAGSHGARLTVSDALGNFVANKECSPRLTVITPLEFASCTPSELISTTGDETTWTVNLKGGIAPYGFTLAGTDGLSGTTEKTKITYTIAGTKTATVSNLTSSDGQAVIGSFNCTSATVEAAVAKLTALCSADDKTITVDNDITWSASVSGGKTPYTYNWTGTDSLSGSNSTVNKTYTKEGDKTAKVNVASSDGQVVTSADCTAEVSEKSSGGNSGSSSNNNNRTTTTNVQTVTEATTPSNTVTFTSTNRSSGTTGGTVASAATSTETASTTDAATDETASSTQEEIDRSNQLANVSSFVFFAEHKILSALIALIVAIVAWLIFGMKRNKKEEEVS